MFFWYPVQLRSHVYQKNMYFTKEGWSRGSVSAWDARFWCLNPAEVKKTSFFLISQTTSDFRPINLEKVLLSTRTYCLQILINVSLYTCQLVDSVVSNETLTGAELSANTHQNKSSSKTVSSKRAVESGRFYCFSISINFRSWIT